MSRAVVSSPQPNPANVLAPNIARQMVGANNRAAVGGIKVEPARVGAPRPFIHRVNVACRLDHLPNSEHERGSQDAIGNAGENLFCHCRFSRLSPLSLFRIE